MATAENAHTGAVEQQVDKGLKSGALGLVSTTVMGVASTAPAYSLAATLGFIVAVVGLGSPIVAVIAFVPIFLTSIGYSELNKADPDCGTTFTWGTRAFGPRTGWAGGWAIVAADVLVMASLAQVAGQYVFLLFGADGIGSNPTSGWVLLVGLLWIAVDDLHLLPGHRGLGGVPAGAARASSWSCWLVFSVTALVRVGTGNHPAGSITPAWSWFNPMQGGFSGVRQRHHPDALHLLGLGHRGGGQRGDQGPDQDAGTCRHPFHGHPPGHLRAGDLRGTVVRRHRQQGHRARQQRQHRRRDLRARQRGLRRARDRDRSWPGC